MNNENKELLPRELILKIFEMSLEEIKKEIRNFIEDFKKESYKEEKKERIIRELEGKLERLNPKENVYEILILYVSNIEKMEEWFRSFKIEEGIYIVNIM